MNDTLKWAVCNRTQDLPWDMAICCEHSTIRAESASLLLGAYLSSSSSRTRASRSWSDSQTCEGAGLWDPDPHSSAVHPLMPPPPLHWTPPRMMQDLRLPKNISSQSNRHAANVIQILCLPNTHTPNLITLSKESHHRISEFRWNSIEDSLSAEEQQGR